MDERVVLLTGAGSGIGAVTALAFADRGWTVYATDVETPLPDAVRAHCHTLELDVTDPEQCRAVVDRILSATGRLDCLVNNAGYAVAGAIEDVDDDAVREEFDVLVHGPRRLVQAVLPTMRAQGGRIITVASALATTAYPGMGAYSAGKAAVESMTDALRMELADDPIHVSLVEPTWVDTGFADGALSGLDGDRSGEYAEVYDALETGWVLDGGPLATTPEAVAAAVLAAATDDAPAARYPVGRFARLVRWTGWLPAPVADRLRRWFGRVTTWLGRRL